MPYSTFEDSRFDGKPVNLYFFEGSLDASLGFDAGVLGPFAFTDADIAITLDSVVYAPWPITHGDIEVSGTEDKRSLTVDLARGTSLDALFNAYPPSQPVRLLIRRGHIGDTVTLSNFPIEWSGQISGVSYPENKLQLVCEPTSVTMQRPGLRRNYQLGCPLPLYGGECRASKASASQSRTASAVSGNQITIGSAVTTPRGVTGFIGGTVEWLRGDGLREIATILTINVAGTIITVRGAVRGLTSGMTVSLAAGCNRTMDHCSGIHANIHNYGGQPFIPLENPLSQSSIFY